MPAARSTSSSVPSREVRSRRSGHTPSCTPATQTRSHSRPLDACAVSSRTVSPATARAAPVSPGSSWAERCATKARTSADGSRSTKPAAASNSATTASRSRSATAPDGPPAALARAHRAARPLLCHIAHSTSSAVPSCASASRPASSTAATRRAGRETCSGSDSSSASSPSAMASGAPALGGVDALLGQRDADGAAQPAQVEDGGPAQRRGEQRLGGRLVEPDRGAVGLGPGRGRRQQRGQRAQQRRDGRLPGQRQVVGGDRDRDARRGQRAAQRAEGAGGADDDRHLRPRHAVEQVRPAQDVGQVGGLDRRGAEDVHLGGAGLGAVDRRPAGGAPTGPGSPSATFRLIRSSSSPDRRQTPERDPAGRPAVGVPEPLGELDDAARLGAAEGVDRLVGVADRDQVAAAAGEQLEQLDLGGVGVLVLVDEQPAGALALLPQQLRVAVELGDGLADELGRVVSGRVAAAGGGEGGDGLVLLLERGGVHPVVAARTPGPRRPAAPSRRPRSVARSSSSRSSVRKPAVPSAGASAAGQRTAPSSSASPREQLGDDGVLLRRGQQPGRGVAAEQRRAAEDAVGVGVEGAGQRLADGPGDPAGDPGAQLGGGLAAEGQDEDLLGVDAGVDPRGDRLDDRRRLAGARAGQHEQRAAGMVDDGLLGGIQRAEPRGADASPATSR